MDITEPSHQIIKSFYKKTELIDCESFHKIIDKINLLYKLLVNLIYFTNIK